MPRSKPRTSQRSATAKPDHPPAGETSADTRDEWRAGGSFPIVGIGASAGGLEAFRDLLTHLPLDTGMGFVLVQHLDPQHESALTEILQRATSLPVCEVTNSLSVEPNHVYVIPPNANLSITAGVLTLRPRPQARTPTRSIDAFLEALAEDQRERAIGVILSGTATDGTLGLEAIKAEGGITFAQDDSARHDSMPRSAVAAGCVDFVLSPERIAKEIARIAKHPAVAGAGPASRTRAEADRAFATARKDDDTPLPSGWHGRPPTGATQARAEDGFKKTLLLLRNHTGVDFSLYKSSTIERRITRRMVLSRQNALADYAQFLRGNTEELNALYSDVLISVTSFFRNPDAFDVLQRKVWPELLKQRSDDPLRVWVLGCSTGQEAYSIAMAFVEATEKAPRLRTLQVFATDLNDTLLGKARHGLYAKSVARDVSPERLRRFFVEEEGGYRVSKSLREMVVFARQNVISDPPFSRMDLISCRNLLIYFEPGLQKKVFPVFHYALKPGGFLYLGASESIGGFTELFEPMDKKHRIYAKKAAPTPAFQLPARRERGEPPPSRSRKAGNSLQMQAEHGAAVDGFRAELSAQREADRVTVNQFAPPAVLINAELQVLQFRGQTGAYLEPPKGKASFDVLKMARNGLMLPLRAAINKAKKESKPARKEHVRIEQDGKTRTINVDVIPLKNLRERCFLIVFEDADKAGIAAPAADASRTPRGGESRRMGELETELAETRDYLQSIQEQHEAANEELQASNEEVQSANEELQSLNEELETSKEELESANEELTTVNEEMANRNTELNRLNSDLVNIQTSAHQAIVLLDRNLTIRRFSTQAEKQFNLLAADVGRPIGNVRHALDLPDLDAFITGVIDTVHADEREVRDKDGRWFSLRVRPYLTLDNKVDGAVLVLVDIETLKRSEQAISGAREYAENIIETVREPLLVLDADLRVERINRSFSKGFNVTPAGTVGTLLYELGNRQWDIAELRILLGDVITRNSTIQDFSVTLDFEQLGRRTMLLNARRMYNPENKADRILLAIEDITDRNQTEDALRQSHAELRSHGHTVEALNAELRASQERYRTLFELGPVAVYACDASGVIQQFNRRAAELWGREPASGDTDERFCGSFRLFRPDGSFMPHEQCPMAEVVSGQRSEVRDAEVLIKRPDGSLVTVVVNIRPLKNPHGEVTGAINCFYDITERKRAEEALRASAERYRTLFESIDEGFCIIEKVEGAPGEPLDFRYVEANPAFAAQSGVSGVVGKTIRQAFPGEPEEWFHTYNAIVRTGEPIRFERGLVTQGRVLELYAFRIEDNTHRRVAVIFKDVTARKQVEDARATLAAIVQSSDDAIVAKDLNGVITNWNAGAERLFGYTAGEAVGQSVTLLIPPDRLDEETSILERIRQGQLIDHFETVRRRKDSTLVDVSVTISPIRDDRGHVVGASKIARDITEQKQTAEMLRQADRRKDEFLAMLGHELRNPLAPIVTALELMKLRGTDVFRRERDVIERQVRHVSRLVNDMLDIERITRGKVSLEKELIEVSIVVAKAIEIAEPLIDQRAHQLHVDVAPTGLVVEADPVRLSQVFANLLTNAARYTQPGGRIDVAAKLGPGEVIVDITDTGMGLSPDFLPRVFDLFVQGARPVDRSEGGLGLGLALVQSLVKMHGGAVSAHSEGPGTGSRFSVRLPVSDSARVRVEDSVPVLVAEDLEIGSCRRILLIDDNADAANILRDMLTTLGHEVVVAYDGPQALIALESFEADLAVVDIGLPVMDGYELAERIRTRKGWRVPRLVAMTGYGQPNDLARSREAGFDEHLVKPVDMAALVAVIDRPERSDTPSH